MSLIELFFPIATVILAVGCYTCYRTGKPLREKAKEEAKEAAEKLARDEREGREKNRRANQKAEVFADLEAVLNDPEYHLRDNQYGSATRGRHRFQALYDLAKFMAEHRRLKEHNLDMQTRLDAQGKKLRELQGQMTELHRAMALNTGDF